MAYLLNSYLNSTSQVDILNATHDVKRAFRESQVQDGLLTVFIPHPTAGIILLENDPEIKEAFKNVIMQMVEDPSGTRPLRKSGTGHKQAHLRAAMLHSSVVIPIKDSKLLLGPWQEVIVVDFDDKVGRREVNIFVMGEAAKK